MTAGFDHSIERENDSDNVEYVMRRIRENYITDSDTLSCRSARTRTRANMWTGKSR